MVLATYEQTKDGYYIVYLMEDYIPQLRAYCRTWEDVKEILEEYYIVNIFEDLRNAHPCPAVYNKGKLSPEEIRIWDNNKDAWIYALRNNYKLIHAERYGIFDPEELRKLEKIAKRNDWEITRKFGPPAPPKREVNINIYL